VPAGPPPYLAVAHVCRTFGLSPSRKGPKPWEARGRENKKQYRRRFRTKKAAEQFEPEVSKREERRRNGLPEERENIPYEELTELFLDGLPQGDMTKLHIRDSMRQVLDVGVEWGYPRNPVRAKTVRAPRVPEPDVRPFACWSEVNAVADAAGRYGPLVRFACATGLRPEEWIALQWLDLDIAGRQVNVNKVCVEGMLRRDRGKTDAAFRLVLLQEQAVQALRSLPRPLDSTALVFPAPDAATSTSTTGGSPGSQCLSAQGWSIGPSTSSGTRTRPRPLGWR
jgi:integrase